MQTDSLYGDVKRWVMGKPGKALESLTYATLISVPFLYDSDAAKDAYAFVKGLIQGTNAGRDGYGREFDMTRGRNQEKVPFCSIEEMQNLCDRIRKWAAENFKDGFAGASKILVLTDEKQWDVDVRNVYVVPLGKGSDNFRVAVISVFSSNGKVVVGRISKDQFDNMKKVARGKEPSQPAPAPAPTAPPKNIPDLQEHDDVPFEGEKDPQHKMTEQKEPLQPAPAPTAPPENIPDLQQRDSAKVQGEKGPQKNEMLDQKDHGGDIEAGGVASFLDFPEGKDSQDLVAFIQAGLAARQTSMQFRVHGLGPRSSGYDSFIDKKDEYYEDVIQRVEQWISTKVKDHHVFVARNVGSYGHTIYFFTDMGSPPARKAYMQVYIDDTYITVRKDNGMYDASSQFGKSVKLSSKMLQPTLLFMGSRVLPLQRIIVTGVATHHHTCGRCGKAVLLPVLR